MREKQYFSIFLCTFAQKSYKYKHYGKAYHSLDS